MLERVDIPQPQITGFPSPITYKMDLKTKIFPETGIPIKKKKIFNYLNLWVKKGLITAEEKNQTKPILKEFGVMFFTPLQAAKDLIRKIRPDFSIS